MHWSSAEISAWFPLLLQPYLLLLSTNSGRSSRARPHREGTHSQLLLLLLLLLCFSFNPSLLCHLPQSLALAAWEQPGRKECTGLQQRFRLGLHFYIRFYCICFSFSPSLLCHLPQSRALAAGEQPGRIKVHWSSAEISAWFPLLLQPYLLLLLSI